MKHRDSGKSFPETKSSDKKAEKTSTKGLEMKRDKRTDAVSGTANVVEIV